MNPNLLFSIWGSCTLLIIVAILITKKVRRQPIPSLEEVADLAFGVGSTLVGLELIWQAFTPSKIQDCLGWDGKIAFVVGGGSAVWIGIKLIWKKF